METKVEIGEPVIKSEIKTVSRKKANLKKILTYLAFVGPALIFFLVIQIIPFLMGIYYSFTSWNGVSSVVEWVGLENYIKIFKSDPKFFDSFIFTTKFMLASVIISNLLGFGLALLLNAALKSRNLLRTVFFIPNVIGGLLLGFIWQFIFVKGFAAIGNLTDLSVFKLPWLGDETTAFWGIVIVFAWQISGYMMVIYIAALQGVDQTLLEAARIDGASSWTLLTKIIIPLILPAFTICFFLTISMAFKIFDLNISLTGGGPFNSTQSVAINIYQEAFQNNRYGLGTAKSILFFLVVAIFTTVQVMMTKKREVEA
ncbi:MULTISPECIES: carbohydrate ABC transporter permease [Cytobacillus]|uniref:Multiple sugar ABC transporter, permease protein MsmF n=1 Tax=Cytobacillus firmus TaxID=1399 RepID=A0A0J5VF92_CYTFI|nr:MULTISPECIES: sugar ABC transporter permease [Cytobacillus]KAF0821685.1 Multiple sugar ABC transporter, permease protein MsmF [Cytobacillus firmus]KML34276.1 ABC transporter permease [Cytobacillus firmus]MBG9443088.1 ABC transporter permease [Cytobacillus firmus]MBY6053819.1 sugar ABC transporter permease [Cytobacillus firmus]MCC3645073.1 sugar ABC transporter permease [Cytobacillus oceanisediminis]